MPETTMRILRLLRTNRTEARRAEDVPTELPALGRWGTSLRPALKPPSTNCARTTASVFRRTSKLRSSPTPRFLCQRLASRGSGFSRGWRAVREMSPADHSGHSL
jgi:hypothetical protein